MQKLLLLVLGLAVLLGGFFSLNNYIYEEKQAVTGATPKDAEYIIEGRRVKLENGLAETEAAPGSASKVTTRYFGNEVSYDLNKDGREDKVFLLTQETGGSGTFFYVVAALNTESGYVGSQALFLGDRIAPQTTEISRNPNHDRVIVVNYADRNPGEPMTTQPSLGKSIWLKLDPESLQFGEVVQNFEGEADPSRMTLDMKSWTWISAFYEDGRVVKPKNSADFGIVFTNDGRISIKTDCNSGSGSYTVEGGKIAFGPIASTKMYCEGSQESEFFQLISNSTGYLFTSKGELILQLKFDSGTVTFR